MEIIWNPSAVWSTREIIQFTDNRNFKKDVAVILKSVDKNAKNVARKPAPTQPITKKLIMKSPSPRTKQKLRLSAMNGANGTAHKTSPAIIKKSSQETKNKKVLGARNNVFPPPSMSFKFMDLPGSVNGKENLKPCTPMNKRDLFDTFKFTPVTETKHNGTTHNFDHLASLPTPNSTAKTVPAKMSFIPESPFIQQCQTTEPRSPLSDGDFRLQRLNTTATIDSTPKILMNDRTTTLYDCQTPGNYSEVDSSRIYEYISNCSQYAAQNTPGTTVQTAYSYSFKQSITSTVTETTSEVLTIPETQMQGRRLLLDPASPRAHNISETTVNRTQILSSPAALPQLPMIEEEYSGIELGETYVSAETPHQRTYNVVKTPTAENLTRDISMVGTPLRKKFQSMKELNDSKDNMSLEQQILKHNQGSMPNLHKLETVKSIENNRYFYQSIEKDLPQTENENECLGDTSICSMKSTVSTQSVAFKEHEILAQSSRFNINEIERSSKSKSNKNNQPIYFEIGKQSNDNSNVNISSSSISSTSSFKQNLRKKSTQAEIEDSNVFVAPSSRASVITFVGRQSALNKKRLRDESSDTHKKSLAKQSPPKRACMDTSISSSPRLTKGQSFRTNTWGGTMPKKFRIPGIPPQKLTLKKQSDERIILFDPELHMRGKH